MEDNKILEQHKLREDYDKRGVRVYVTHNQAVGSKFCIECYRKQTKKEVEKDPDNAWKMKRVGHIVSFWTRDEAEEKALKLAEETLEEYEKDFYTGKE